MLSFFSKTDLFYKIRRYFKQRYFLSVYEKLVFGDYSFVLRKIFEWLLNFVIISVLIITFHYVLNKNFWLYSFEWFHVYILIPVFWYYVPCVVILILINAYISNVPPFLQIARMNRFLRDFNGMCIFITLIGAISQTAGGCVWQIPLILLEEPGYRWQRFGGEIFNDNILFWGYLIITILLFYVLILYLKIIKHLEKTKINP